MFRPDGTDWPDALILDSKRGLLAIDVAEGSIDPKDRTLIVALNRKIASLRQDISEVADLPLKRRVLVSGSSTGEPVLLGSDELADGSWVAGWLESDVPAELLDDCERKLAPALVFPTIPVRSISDEGADERAGYRLRLDTRQSDIATQFIPDVAILRGPPGSGKTLVLAARARWLAENHPNWTIQILCFNRLLVPYLRGLVSDQPTVRVSTFGRFAHSQRHRIDLGDEERADADLKVAKNRGIQPAVDAILVDEWQDFLPAWTRFALETLRPGRGGVLLAGDEDQALYRDVDVSKALAGRSVREITLGQPYRCTAPILRVAAALDSAFTIEGIDYAPEGEPVDLVWAESPIGQAEAVATDAYLLLADGRRPQDIGILVTYRRHIGAVCRALAGRDIPYQVVRNDEADAYQRDTPAVTVMTVHSAKGYEFAAVFLVGLEGLPQPDSPENARWPRVGYVGATRARDQLVVTYSKDGYYLNRLRALPTYTRRWTWPDDYPVEA
ncbi:AAA family ATPase [Actinoplanes sp. NBC_00393]|uniref:3'-5' exonuclease n=1 Tax=Actinoplanes sp. NBC_00393 TaxID=2975953 RepID=UPI002E1E8803